MAAADVLEPGNIDLTKRPVVKNADGSISTVRSIGVNIDGQEVLIPTVSPDGRILSDRDAIQLYKLSGQHLGKFKTAAASTAYAQQLHQEQERMYAVNPPAAFGSPKPFDVEGARAAGYTDAEIAGYLAKSRKFDLAGAQKAGYSDGEIISHLLKPAPVKSGADLIPGAPAPGSQAPAPAPSLAQKAVGTGEAALATISSPFAFLNGLAAGGNTFVKRLLAEATGQPNPEQYDPGKAFEQGSAAMQYVPRTESGQEQTAAIADAAQGLAPLAGLTGEAALLSQAMRGARTAAPVTTTARAAAEGTARDVAGAAGAAAVQKTIDATQRAVSNAKQAATTLPRRALAMIGRAEEPTAPTPGTMGSAGAAATDIARQRVATAESLGLSGDTGLTLGQATRDPAQLKFEVDTAGKNMELGGAIRERKIAQNEALLRAIENDIDKTGSQAPTVRAVGESVDKALTNQYMIDKRKVDNLYKIARESPEAQALVNLEMPVAIGSGAEAKTMTPLSFINDQPEGLPNSAVADAARKYAVKLGIAENRDGQLVPLQATIQQMEDWRTAIAGAIDPSKRPDLRSGTILKALIDGQTEPVAGPKFREARNGRARFGQNYEDRAAVAKLLAKKPGTQDRAVALEDVFDHTIMKGSLDDVRNMRRVLQRSGAEGQQAWKELQGQTLRDIRDRAIQSATTDSAGRRILSPAALDKAIRGLDYDGKLDFIFGKQGAQRLRDVNEIASVAKTLPPEAAINYTNTATTLVAAFADAGLIAATGIPAPVATLTRAGLKHIKDAKTRQRIAQALRGLDGKGQD